MSAVAKPAVATATARPAVATAVAARPAVASTTARPAVATAATARPAVATASATTATARPAVATAGAARTTVASSATAAVARAVTAAPATATASRTTTAAQPVRTTTAAVSSVSGARPTSSATPATGVARTTTATAAAAPVSVARTTTAAATPSAGVARTTTATAGVARTSASATAARTTATASPGSSASSTCGVARTTTAAPSTSVGVSRTTPATGVARTTATTTASVARTSVASPTSARTTTASATTTGVARTTATASPARVTSAAAQPARTTAAVASPARTTAAVASSARTTAAVASPARTTAAVASSARTTAAVASSARTTAAVAAPARTTTTAAVRTTTAAKPVAAVESAGRVESRPISSTVRFTFEHFDKDASGTLEMRELAAALRHLGMNYTTDQTISIMNKYDSQSRGNLTLDEFNVMILELQEERERERNEKRGSGMRLDTSRAPVAASIVMKPAEIATQMKSQEVAMAFQQHKIAISELYENYARSRTAAAAQAVRLDVDNCLQMLRDFKMLPEHLSEPDVHNVYEQFRTASAPSQAARSSRNVTEDRDGVSRRDFDELLLRISGVVAHRSDSLRNASPRQKLFNLFKHFSVGSIAQMRAVFSAGKGGETAARRASQATGPKTREREAAALKLQSVQKGRAVRTSAPQAVVAGHRKPKAIDVKVHAVALSAATLAADPSLRQVQVGAQLGGSKEVSEVCTSAFAVQDRAIAVEWGVTFKLGPKSAALKAVRTAMYKAPPLVANLATLQSNDGSVASAVREAFEQFDMQRSGLIDGRDVGSAIANLGIDVDSSDIAVKTMNKHIEQSPGKLTISQFDGLVQELLARLEAQADRDIIRTQPFLPLRISVCAVHSNAWAPPVELAHTEVNLAKETDLSREELLLVSTEDGGPMGTVSVSIKAASAMKPHMAVRRAFAAADTNGDGSLARSELVRAFKRIGIVASELAVQQFAAHDVNGDDRLSLSEFEKLYRSMAGLDLPQQKRMELTRAGVRGSYAAPVTAAGAISDGSKAVLFAKRIALEQMEPNRPYTFWVDAHCRLEIIEVLLQPKSNARHCVQMTARDAEGKIKVERATIFDSGAFFNLDTPLNARGYQAVKGGPAWSFPGPCLYELTLAGSPGPMPLKMRMVSRFEVDEQLMERETKEHPLLATPRQAAPAVYSGTFGGDGVSRSGGWAGGIGANSIEMPSTAGSTYALVRPPSAPQLSDSVAPVKPSFSGVQGAAASNYDRFEPRPIAERTAELKPSSALYTSSASYPLTSEARQPSAPRGSITSSEVYSVPPSVYLNCQPASKHSQPSMSSNSAPSGLSSAALDRAFEKFDRGATGYLSMKDVAAALRSLGIKVTPKTLAFFAEADADADGALRLGEFRALVATLERELPNDPEASTAVAGGADGDGVQVSELMEAKVVFDRHDRDKNGYLSTRELRHALKDLHLEADSAQAIAVLHEYDRDSDGRLDLPEFARLLRKLRAMQGLAPAAMAASQRAAFRAYDVRGVGTIPVADVRPALLRAGVDTSSAVAVAIFASLQDQPRSAVDFAQFQRIAHAITSAGSAVPPTGAPPSTVSSPSRRPQSAAPAYPYGCQAGGMPAATTAALPSSASALASKGFVSAYPPGYKHTGALPASSSSLASKALGAAYPPR